MQCVVGTNRSNTQIKWDTNLIRIPCHMHGSLFFLQVFGSFGHVEMIGGRSEEEVDGMGGFSSVSVLLICWWCVAIVPCSRTIGSFAIFQIQCTWNILTSKWKCILSAFEPFSGTYEKSWIIHIKPSSVEERTLGNRIASVLMVHITAIVRLGHTMELPCQPKSAHS